MIAIDTNLLVYAHREDSPWHTQALKVVMELAEGGSRWGIPWPCVHEFLAVVTHSRIYRPPTPSDIALQSMKVWLGSPSLQLLGEGIDHMTHLEMLVLKGKISGSTIHDARIAAICLSHGVKEFWSADRDFSRFPSIRVKNHLLIP